MLKSLKTHKNKDLIKKELSGYSGIYTLINNPTLDIYVGSGTNLFKRIQSYLLPSYLNSNKYNSIIQNALNKYGYGEFTLLILEPYSSNNLDKGFKNFLFSREQHFIDILNPKYNILKFAGSSLGHKPSEETRKK